MSLPCNIGFQTWMQGTVLSLFDSNYGPHLKSSPWGTSLLPSEGPKDTLTDSLSVEEN